VLQKSRALGIKTPILILTANDAVEDRVKGLDCGADDYCTKPFDLKELGARIRALLRRAQGRVENIIRYKNLTIEPEAHKASIDDQELTISRREFSLLHKLVENQGKVMSRDALTQALYGWDDEVDSNALEVHIHNLRKKIGSDVIKTVRGVGYIVQQEEKD
jgi:two-component system response regulator QseB